MSKKIKKIREKVENVYYKNLDEILEVSAILKSLKCAFDYDDDTLTIPDVRLVINVIQQKLQLIEQYTDDLSLI